MIKLSYLFDLYKKNTMDIWIFSRQKNLYKSLTFFKSVWTLNLCKSLNSIHIFFLFFGIELDDVFLIELHFLFYFLSIFLATYFDFFLRTWCYNKNRSLGFGFYLSIQGCLAIPNSLQLQEAGCFYDLVQWIH